MHRVGLIIELLEPAIFSASAATAAAHDTVHVIPGSALLGAAARHYQTFKDKGQAWDAFHSGAVRFEDGLPLTDSGECALPMPNCLHVKKRELPVFGEKCNVVNGTIAAALDTKTNDQPDQYVQLRGNFLTASGAQHRVKTLSDTKSAILEGEMRAADGQLFVYQALEAGQRFYAEITGVDSALVGSIATKLLGRQQLGRSKSAEFGAVNVIPSNSTLTLPVTPISNGTLVLWCLSPLALLDVFGNPTLVPTAASLGLKEGKFVPERSFIRFTTQRSFNQHRNSFDVDRPVLQRGSVLVFSGVDPADLAKLADGIGQHQNLGYGRVWVNPPMLQATALSALGGAAQSMNPQNAKLSAVTTNPNLLSWMKKQANSSAATNHALAKTMVAELTTLYATANRDTVNLARASAGPSKSQWGAVMEILKDAKDVTGASATLFSATGCCKPTGVGWQDRVYDGTKMTSFYEWFKSKVDAKPTLATLQQFSREALRAAELAGGRR